MDRRLVFGIVGFTLAVASWVCFYIGYFTGGITGDAIQWVSVTGFLLGWKAVQSKYPRWWLLLVPQIPMAALSIVYRALNGAQERSIAVGLLNLIGVPALFLYPFVAHIFPFALYLDARAMQAVSNDWNPPAEVYGLIGMTALGSSVSYILPLPQTGFPLRSLLEGIATLVALTYLYQRHKHYGLLPHSF